MRWLQISLICLILGSLVVTIGQACAPMQAGNKPSTATGSSTGLNVLPPPICVTDPAAEGCPNDGSANANAYGFTDLVSAQGTVTGEAKDPANANTSVTVYFFADGPQGTGTPAGVTVADQMGLGNSGGAHRFKFLLPANLRNGTVHTLHAYTQINGIYQELGGSPQTYAAYTASPEGMNYYETMIRPQLQTRCSGCHSVNHAGHFANLLTPTKFKGATATNNDLINKMSGMNHGGGSFCAKTAAPCSLISTWWTMEFGP